MYNKYTEYNNETEEQYLWKVGQAKDSGLIDLSWDDIADLMNKQFRTDETEYRTGSAYRKPYQQAKRFYEMGVFNNLDEDEYLNKLKKAKDDVRFEKYKLQTEKTEYARWRREEARDELIVEKIVDAINKLPEIKIPKFEPLKEEKENSEYLLCFGDAHFGIEFEVPDLTGRNINKYSPEIFFERMEILLNKTIEIVKKENISHLSVWELGDGLDGILRLTSQLQKLRYGIVDGTIIYANYLADWLNRLTKYTRVYFQMVKDSNHNQLRICGAPKNAFTGENMSKVMIALIKARLENNERFYIVENPTGNCFAELAECNIMGIHGEVKNLCRSVGDFSVAYNMPIHYIIGAHVHHEKYEEVGKGFEALNIPSIVGVDPYGMSLVKTSASAAKMFKFEQGYGKTLEHTIRLD